MKPGEITHYTLDLTSWRTDDGTPATILRLPSLWELQVRIRFRLVSAALQVSIGLMWCAMSLTRCALMVHRAACAMKEAS